MSCALSNVTIPRKSGSPVSFNRSGRILLPDESGQWNDEVKWCQQIGKGV